LTGLWGCAGPFNVALRRAVGSFSVEPMSFRIGPFVSALLAGCCLAINGCAPLAENHADEQKDPHFQTGKSRRRNLDFRGAIEAFEKALEANPRSAFAHYELAVIYDEHENDYASALYHYNRVLQLRPNVYPADNARQRIEVCKQELAKSVSVAPMLQTLQRDMMKLMSENQLLKKQLEAAQLALASRATSAPVATNLIGQAPQPSRSGATGKTDMAANLRPASSSTSSGSTSPLSNERASVTTASRAKAHTVVTGDTPTSIARKYGVKLGAFMAANPALNARRLKTGQIVNIPMQ
jgi:LysM repeat protein